MAVDPDGDGCHEPKRALAVLLQNDRVFPTVAPLHVASVGDVLLTTFPAEVTVVAGLRARHRMEEWLRERTGGSPWSRVVQVTHASEYFQYATTEDEYQRQSYEGASTLYGPGTLRLFTNEQLCLTRTLLGGPPCARGEADVGPIGSRRPLTWETTTTDLSSRLTRFEEPAILGAPHRTTRDGEVGLRVEVRQRRGGEVSHEVRARVVDADTGAVLADDEGAAMSIRFVAGDIPGGCSERAAARGGCPFWEVDWFPVAGTFAMLAGHRARFELKFSAHDAAWPARSAPMTVPVE